MPWSILWTIHNGAGIAMEIGALPSSTIMHEELPEAFGGVKMTVRMAKTTASAIFLDVGLPYRLIPSRHAEPADKPAPSTSSLIAGKSTVFTNSAI